MWDVRLMPEAEKELLALPLREGQSILEAIAKLRAEGPALRAPHQSNIVGIDSSLRELRPRRGNSRWRAFYRRIGDRFVIAAVGPEAMVNRRGFDRAVNLAVSRLNEIETGERTTL